VGPVSREDYREAIAKMAASRKARTSREDEVESALRVSMPGLLRRLMEKHGAVRPALRELNARLDEVEMEENVSPPTFYEWLDKYRLR